MNDRADDGLRSPVIVVIGGLLESVAAQHDERAVLERAVLLLARELGLDWVSCALREAADRAPKILVSLPSDGTVLCAGAVVSEPSGLLRAMAAGRQFVQDDLGEESSRQGLWEEPPLLRLGISSYAAIPLTRRGESFGALGVGSRDPHGLASRLDLLTQLGVLIAEIAGMTRLVREVHLGIERLGEKVSLPTFHL